MKKPVLLGIILLTVVYLVFPIDLIPDVIPVAGLLDDFMVTVGGYLSYLIAGHFIPENVIDREKN
jgi:uncharacterized membrane protein YkvA (DUF1232 family)